MKKEERNVLFSEEKVDQKQLASILFQDIQQEPVKLSNCATNIHLIQSTNPSPISTNCSIKRYCSHTENHLTSHPLEKYHYWWKGHKKRKKNQHWNKKHLAAQMGVDSNPEGVDINANSQPLLVLPPFDYLVGRCDMSQFLRDPATADERLSQEK